MVVGVGEVVLSAEVVVSAVVNIKGVVVGTVVVVVVHG